ncbi:Lysophospholipase, alpha-beta hydrolase superfamily [Roseovarius azorensis]|uniref:Lysophospholipase, alpha-beta hydrolase superfamily n=1 Tax=Roseovarius azorensis TaxID=1287727 RepID=A0A1H7JCT4_9RHOB|nr:alpha/beta fold hydrolase [Roseovarius azorensis]SEK72336.1 Lysophospholipase, alpha-beta hydrolase superfamily [Roseovarius azorensis]
MHLALSENDALFYLHHPPTQPGAPTFVFVNALTGSTDAWEASVAPALRAQGFGTLSYNFRGQADSPFGPALELTDQVIVADLERLLAELKPARPILVGLSIGGLYAARAVLNGAGAAGLVLLNTLREIGPRIDWVNTAMARIVAHGGVGLFLDALFPLLVNGDFAAKARANFLRGDYTPLPPEHGHMNLMRNAAATDWNLDYSALTLPVLVITGLQDRVFLDRDIVNRLYATLPDARREDWAEAGHLLPQEAPDRLAASLARFATETVA